MKRVYKLLLLALLFAVPARAQTVIGNQHTTVGTLEGSHVFTGSKITSLSVTWHTQTMRWMMMFDAKTVPPNGALTPASNLIVCQFIQGAGDQADGTQNYDWSAHPIIVQTGVVVVISTNPASCTAMTADGSNNWLAGQMQ